MLNEISEALENDRNKRNCVDFGINDIEIDTSEWVRKFDTAWHHFEGEARLCEISSKNGGYAYAF